MDFIMCAIASGSSGNCTFLQAGDSRILIDVGISGKKVIAGLEEIEVDPSTIQGIFITHEHSDHIKGVGIFSRKYDIPIYATEKVWETMMTYNMIGKIKEENQKYIIKDEYLQLQDLKILPYSIYHDAVDPVGYIFEYRGKKITLATDIGMIDKHIMDHLRGSNGILMEFNHDIHMVQAGSYPFQLKQRVLGDYGHLSNEVAAQVLVDIYHEDLKWALLGHLSQENNIPDLAYITAKVALEEQNIKVGKDIELSVARRNGVSQILAV